MKILKKNVFRPFEPRLGLKISGEGWGPRIRHCIEFKIFSNQLKQFDSRFIRAAWPIELGAKQ